MRKTLLIIDDEKDIGAMLKQYFELKDYTVMLAENGLAGIEKAAKQPDLILLDINMPDVDGIEVCRRIRSSNSRIGIIMLTARTQEMDKVTGLMTGADDYVTWWRAPSCF